MTSSLHELSGLRLERLKRLYRQYPDAYAADVLKVEWWDKQLDVAAAIIQHRKVEAKASHSVGKTHLGGGLTNWYYDCFDPSITLTTAPTAQQVEDLLWKEVRTQRRGRPGLQPKAPRMESAPNHFASGYTARDANAFQGRHERNVFMLFDESTGIDGPFWDAAEGILTGGDSCRWLQFLNPTDTASRAYEEEQSGDWHVITISALEHPNILADLNGLPVPFPGAVRLEWVLERVKRWCTPISSRERRATDIEFPPGSGNWHRPGPLFEGRVLGRWPSLATTSIWSEGLWLAALVPQRVPVAPLEIGCDVARFGDDNTSVLARRGPCALHHESHNGWSTSQIAGLLKRLASILAQPGEDPRSVIIRIDDAGVGGGVVDQADGYNFIPINGANKALDPEQYRNKRTELWFASAERAAEGDMDLSRLSEGSQKLLRTQLMAPTWKMDSAGRRVAEPKADTKKRLKRSPDDADALNNAYAGEGKWEEAFLSDDAMEDFELESSRAARNW